MQEENDEKSQLLAAEDGDIILPLSYKISRTAQLFSLWILFGCYCEITGPVIPELIVQTKSNYEIMAQGIAMRGAGHSLGGILGGFTVDRLFTHIDVICTIWTLMYVAISVAKSYVTSIPALLISFYIQGALETILHTAGYRIIHKTWLDKASVPFHVVNVGFGVGSIIVPLLVRPYLDPRFSGVRTDGTNSQSCNESLDVDTEFWNQGVQNESLYDGLLLSSPAYPAEFVTAYWILAPFGLLITTGFIFNYFYLKKRKIILHIGNKESEDVVLKQKLKNAIAPSACSPSKPGLGLAIVIIVAFYTAGCTPIARVFPKFIFSYAREEACLSVTQSAELQSAYFAAVTGGRLFGCIFSAILSDAVVMQIGVLGILGSSIGLFVVHDHIPYLWTLTCLMGFFTGPIATVIYAWVHHYVELTSMAQILPELGAAAGDVGMLLTLGWSYQTFGPTVLWSYMLAFCAGLSLISWILLMLGRLHGDRFAEEKYKIDKS